MCRSRTEAGGGQASALTNRPGRSWCVVAGRTESCTQARSIGSCMMPLSIPFSQWSHQRRDSCRKPIAGNGVAFCGQAWPHGPISPLRGS